MEKLISKFLFSYQARVKPSTLASYRSILLRHLKPFGSLDRASQVFEDYLSGLPVSGKTRNNLLSCVQVFVDWAQRRGEVEVDWRRIPKFPNCSKKIRPLSLEEAKLLVHGSTWPYRDFFALSILTGLRTSEALALKFKDFDLKKKLIRVERAWSGGQISTTKTGESRTVPLVAEIERIFFRRVRDNLRGSEWFFYSERGGLISLKALRRAWYSHLEAYGIEFTPLYATRHTFASLALAAGEDPLWVARVLGHKRPDQLFLRYASFLEGVKRDGFKIEAILRERVERQLRVVGD